MNVVCRNHEVPSVPKTLKACQAYAVLSSWLESLDENGTRNPNSQAPYLTLPRRDDHESLSEQGTRGKEPTWIIPKSRHRLGFRRVPIGRIKSQRKSVRQRGVLEPEITASHEAYAMTSTFSALCMPVLADVRLLVDDGEYVSS